VQLEEAVDVGHSHDLGMNVREVSVEMSPAKMSKRVPDEWHQLVWMVLVATEGLR
jgi:hypothetical protein